MHVKGLYLLVSPSGAGRGTQSTGVLRNTLADQQSRPVRHPS